MINASRAMRQYRPYLIYAKVSKLSTKYYWEQKKYLSEVSRTLVKVDLLGNLRVPGQGMHDNHVALGVLEKSIVDDEAVLEPLELPQVGEALLLHAS